MEGQEDDVSEIIIREATIVDVADVQRLARLLAQFEFECGFDQDIDPQWAFTEAGVSRIRRQLTGEDGIALVATCDGEVVGFLAGGIRQEKEGPVGGLQGVFVLPAC